MEMERIWKGIGNELEKTGSELESNWKVNGKDLERNWERIWKRTGK